MAPLEFDSFRFRVMVPVKAVYLLTRALRSWKVQACRCSFRIQSVQRSSSETSSCSSISDSLHQLDDLYPVVEISGPWEALGFCLSRAICRLDQAMLTPGGAAGWEDLDGGELLTRPHGSVYPVSILVPQDVASMHLAAVVKQAPDVRVHLGPAVFLPAGWPGDISDPNPEHNFNGELERALRVTGSLPAVLAALRSLGTSLQAPREALRSVLALGGPFRLGFCPPQQGDGPSQSSSSAPSFSRRGEDAPIEAKAVAGAAPQAASASSSSRAVVSASDIAEARALEAMEARGSGVEQGDSVVSNLQEDRGSAKEGHASAQESGWSMRRACADCFFPHVLLSALVGGCPPPPVTLSSGSGRLAGSADATVGLPAPCARAVRRCCGAAPASGAPVGAIG